MVKVSRFDRDNEGSNPSSPAIRYHHPRTHREVHPIMHKRLAPPIVPSTVDLMSLSKEALISEISDLTFSLRVLEGRAVAAETALEDLRSRLKAMIARMD